MSIARRSLIAGMTALLGGCSPAALLNTTVPRSGYKLQPDIGYGDGPRRRLDLYTPETPRSDGKAVIFFYGGSWDSGKKADYLFVGQALAARGIACIIPDYRLYPEIRFPAFVQDGAEATRWAADKVGVENLFVMGHSAGAEIAAMLAVNTPYLANVGVDRMKLRGLIGLAGPYDIVPISSAKLIDIFSGPAHPQTQPLTFARAPLPPALLLHGTTDDTVYPRNSEMLAAAWRTAGAPVELKLMPDVSHIDIVAAFSDFLHKRATTREDVVEYIDTH